VIDVLVVVHIACGVVAVVAGASAMVTVKGGRRHRCAGRTYVAALCGLCCSAAVLAAVDWEQRRPLALLGGLAAVAAGSGWLGIRTRRVAVHISGMGGSYIAVLTAFYVDNGPRLPLWDRLPLVAFWLLPAAVGLPVLVRALRRHGLGRPRRSARQPGAS
jgi:uncharacterized membrane protein